MKRLIAVFSALLMLLALAACSSGGADKPGPSETGQAQPSESGTPAASPSAEDDWAYIQQKGELVIGITEYEPMNYYDENNKLVGFDTEFAEAACSKLGIKPKFVIINWETKEIELASKNIDCIWNGLTVTEERRENMDFTKSYLCNEQVVVIRAADADKYKDLSSLAGASVVAEAGSAGESAIKKDLPTAKYTAVEAQSNALLEVKSGTADAAVIDATMAHSMTGEGTDYSDLMIVPTIDMMDEEYAIGFRLGSTATEQFNKVIDELLKDGTLQKIAEKYGLAERLIQG